MISRLGVLIFRVNKIFITDRETTDELFILFALRF